MINIIPTMLYSRAPSKWDKARICCAFILKDCFFNLHVKVQSPRPRHYSSFLKGREWWSGPESHQCLFQNSKCNCIFSNPKAEIDTSRSCLSIALLTPLIHQDVWSVINVVTDILLLMQMDSVQCPKLSRKHIHLWVLEVSMSIIYVYGCHLITCIIKLWSDIATVRGGGGWPIAEEDIKEIFFMQIGIKKSSYKIAFAHLSSCAR